MTRIFRNAAKILFVGLAALVGQMVLGAALTAVLGPVWPEPTDPQALLLPMALGQLLMVLALVAPTRASTLPRRHLFWALFSAIFGLGVFLTHIEAAVFLVMGQGQLLFGFLIGTLQALWTAGLMVTFFAGPRPVSLATDRHPKRHWWRRLAFSSVLYLALYFVAGMLIYPHIAVFYATQYIPPLVGLIPLQLARGALYVLFVWPLMRSLRLGRTRSSLAMAFMFPILAGVASLLAPNALMPDSVRYWHLLEIGVSNLIFGAAVGFLFTAPRVKLGAPPGSGVS